MASPVPASSSPNPMLVRDRLHRHNLGADTAALPLRPRLRHHPPPPPPGGGDGLHHRRLPWPLLGLHCPPIAVPPLPLQPLLRRHAPTPKQGSPLRRPARLHGLSREGSTLLHSAPCMPRAAAVESKVYICRPDQDEWAASPPVHNAIYDLIFYKGELYCVSYKARIFAFDLHRHDHDLLRPTPRTVTLGGKDRKRQDVRDIDQYMVMYYLVESDGELLVATQYDLARSGAPPLIIFDLHRLGEEGQLVWVEDFGERMLFLGWGCSKSWIGPVPNEFFRNNCSYFVDIDSHSFRLGRFCVGKGEQQLGPSTFAEFHPDPLPTAYSFPLWITPHLDI